MKKLIAVAAILSVMFLGAGTSQALMGVPDAVPGRDVLVPFFMVSMDGFGNENSLITITEVKGTAVTDVVGRRLHLTVWDSDSNHVFDKYIEFTAYDVYSTDARTIIGEMSETGREALEVDLDGNGTNDHWAGYMYFDNENGLNHLIAHAYQISVADGIVAGYVPPALETFVDGHHPMVQGYYSLVEDGVDFDLQQVEAFNANALWAAKCIELDLDPDVPATGLTLYPRFYVHDADSTNILAVWTDEEEALNIDLPGTLNFDFWNEEELKISSPVVIDRELTLIDITKVLPAGLHDDYPHGGWINFTALGAAFNAERYLLVYSIQRAMMADGSTLDVIFEAHRDASGTTAAP